jgi:hypothetical protein
MNPLRTRERGADRGLTKKVVVVIIITTIGPPPPAPQVKLLTVRKEMRRRSIIIEGSDLTHGIAEIITEGTAGGVTAEIGGTAGGAEAEKIIVSMTVVGTGITAADIGQILLLHLHHLRVVGLLRDHHPMIGEERIGILTDAGEMI